jgi:hypothetical protein
MHLLPVQGNTDSLAEAAFSQARAIDSTAATLQFHLVEIRARRGDQAGSALLARQFAKSAADTQLAREVSLISACGPAGFKDLDLQATAVHSPLPLALAARSLGGSAVTAKCALASYAMLLQEDTARTDAADGRRFFALLGLVNVKLGAGRTDEATNALEQFRLRWGAGISLYLLAAPVAPAFADRARTIARQDSVEYGPTYARVPYPVRLWELGVWAAQEGKAGLVRAVAGDLAARAVRGARIDTLIASSMAAHAALAGGDSLLALQRFEQLIAAAAPAEELTWNEAAPLGFDRLVLGRLLIWHKDYARALGVLTVHDSAVPAVYPLYRRASLLLRVDAATALDNAALAASLRNRLAALSGS